MAEGTVSHFHSQNHTSKLYITLNLRSYTSPDDYTITVAAEGTYDVSQCLPTPPSLPKPRNITQV